ncbi:MAG TPA: phosphoglycerate kinase [Acidobacteriota bacterium]|nr:phosphoglycerate kinase [Acidobacteriota bacterium]
MHKMTIDDVDLAGRRVLMRVDFNVPLTDTGVADDTRIRATLPSIRKVIGDGGRAVLVSHLGRPKGKTKPEYSLAPVAAHLSALLGRPVLFGEDCVGPKAAAVVDRLGDGDLCLLENLRFHPGEENNDPEFARQLAAWGDVYINDAFGTAHRAHASTVGVTEHIPICAAGYLMKRELEYLGRLLADPKRPFVALLGGSKVSGKLEVITHLLETVDAILIGGGMAFTFLKAQGKEVGRSLVEDNLVDTARAILRQVEQGGCRLILPTDCVAAPDLEGASKPMTVSIDGIPHNHAGYDIGPESVRAFATELAGAGTIFWNGPMGVFETPPFDTATVALAQAIAAATDRGAISVVGGGDSVAAVHAAAVAERISHISTGGGASLEFMEGKVLPGVAALSDRKAAASVRG